MPPRVRPKLMTRFPPRAPCTSGRPSPQARATSPAMAVETGHSCTVRFHSPRARTSASSRLRSHWSARKASEPRATTSVAER
eukprot:1069600-Alexandrium_andersonii.AAC.1